MMIGRSRSLLRTKKTDWQTDIPTSIIIHIDFVKQSNVAPESIINIANFFKSPNKEIALNIERLM